MSRHSSSEASIRTMSGGAPDRGGDLDPADDPNFALRLQLQEYEELEKTLPPGLLPEDDLEGKLALLRDIAQEQFYAQQQEGVASLLGGQGMPDMAEPHDGADGHTDATDDDDWVTEEDDEEEQEANEVEWLQQLLRRPGMMSGMQMLELLHASGHSSTQDVDVDNMSYEELQDLCERMGKVNVGLKPEQIAERTVLYTYGKEVHAACTEEDTCTVCMYGFEAGDELRKLSCPHYFHVDCIDQWLAESKKCPVCKVEVLKKVPLAKTAAAQPAPTDAAASAHKTPSPKTAKKKRAPGSTRRGASAGAATPAAAPTAGTPSPPKAKRKMPATSSSSSPAGPASSSSRAAPAAPAAKLSASTSSASAPLDARTPPTKKAKKSSKNKAAGASAPGPMFLR